MPVITWAGSKGIYFTRSRPYKKNDQATIESKNNHLVRRIAFYYRYDTPEERVCSIGCGRSSMTGSTTSPRPSNRIGYANSADGRRRRLYDAPQTPLQRLLAAGVLSAAQQAGLIAYRDSLNPAKIGRQIADLQNRLLMLAKEKTEQLYLASIRPPYPTSAKASEPRPAGPFRGHSYLRHRTVFAGTLI